MYKKINIITKQSRATARKRRTIHKEQHRDRREYIEKRIAMKEESMDRIRAEE